MTNNERWEEDSVIINDANGNMAYEVIDVIKPVKLYSGVKKEPLSDWRKELESEG